MGFSKIRCVIEGCQGRGGHTFPTNPKRRQAWLKAINWSDSNDPHPHAVICHQHFSERDYKNSQVDLQNFAEYGSLGKNRRLRLKRKAVPSVFAGSSRTQQTVTEQDGEVLIEITDQKDDSRLNYSEDDCEAIIVVGDSEEVSTEDDVLTIEEDGLTYEYPRLNIPSDYETDDESTDSLGCSDIAEGICRKLGEQDLVCHKTVQGELLFQNFVLPPDDRFDEEDKGHGALIVDDILYKEDGNVEILSERRIPIEYGERDPAVELPEDECEKEESSQSSGLRNSIQNEQQHLQNHDSGVYDDTTIFSDDEPCSTQTIAKDLKPTAAIYTKEAFGTKFTITKKLVPVQPNVLRGKPLPKMMLKRKGKKWIVNKKRKVKRFRKIKPDKRSYPHKTAGVEHDKPTEPSDDKLEGTDEQPQAMPELPCIDVSDDESYTSIEDVADHSPKGSLLPAHSISSLRSDGASTAPEVPSPWETAPLVSTALQPGCRTYSIQQQILQQVASKVGSAAKQRILEQLAKSERAVNGVCQPEAQTDSPPPNCPFKNVIPNLRRSPDSPKPSTCNAAKSKEAKPISDISNMPRNPTRSAKKTVKRVSSKPRLSPKKKAASRSGREANILRRKKTVSNRPKECNGDMLMDLPLLNKAYEKGKPLVMKWDKGIPEEAKFLGASRDKTFYMLEDICIASTKERQLQTKSPPKTVRKLVEEWGDSDEDEDYQLMVISDKPTAKVAPEVLADPDHQVGVTLDDEDCKIVEDQPVIIDLCDDEDSYSDTDTMDSEFGMEFYLEGDSRQRYLSHPPNTAAQSVDKFSEFRSTLISATSVEHPPATLLDELSLADTSNEIVISPDGVLLTSRESIVGPEGGLAEQSSKCAASVFPPEFPPAAAAAVTTAASLSDFPSLENRESVLCRAPFESQDTLVSAYDDHPSPPLAATNPTKESHADISLELLCKQPYEAAGAGPERPLERAESLPSAELYFLAGADSEFTPPVSVGIPADSCPQSSTAESEEVPTASESAPQPAGSPGTPVGICLPDVGDTTAELDDYNVDVVHSELVVSVEEVRPQELPETFESVGLCMDSSEVTSPTAELDPVEPALETSVQGEVPALPGDPSCVHPRESKTVHASSKSYQVIAEDHCYSRLACGSQIEASDLLLKGTIREALNRKCSVKLKRLTPEELACHTRPDTPTPPPAEEFGIEGFSDDDSDFGDPMEQTCYHCDQDFASMKVLRKHISFKHKYNQLICPHCFAGFLCPVQCNEHIRDAHRQMASEITYACTQCSFTTNDHCTLRGHIDVAHKIQRHKTCSECIFKCTSDAAMAEHMDRYHRSVRSQNDCYTVTNIQDLIGEEIMPLPLGVPISGSNCLKPVDTENPLRIVAISSLQAPPKPNVSECLKVPCPDCPSTFRNLVDLGKHIVLVHEKYQCPISTCHQAFEAHKSLKAHMRAHVAPICPICRYRLHTKNQVIKHVRVSHPNEARFCHWCKSCGFVTMYEPALKLHNVVFHSKSLQFSTKCPVCASTSTRNFENAKELLMHTARVHHVVHSQITRSA